MEYTYKLTKSEIDNLFFLLDDFLGINKRMDTLGKSCFIIAGPLGAIFCAWNNQYLAATLWFIIILLEFILFSFLCKKNTKIKVISFKNKIRLKKVPFWAEYQTISVEDDFVVNSLSNGKIKKISLTDIRTLFIDDDLILIIVTPKVLLTAVPFRAFNSEEERELFISTLNQK